MYEGQCLFDNAPANRLWKRWRAGGAPYLTDPDELMLLWELAASGPRGLFPHGQDHHIHDYIAAKLQLPPGVEPVTNAGSPRWLPKAR